MRAVYLVRHGRPDFPGGLPFCLGRQELPLSPEGEAQAGALGAYFHGLPTARVAASPLLRCQQTQGRIGGDYELIPGLAEVDMGAWSGLTFSEIRRRWPERYARRGQDPLHVAPPAGESMAQCSARALDAFWTLTRRQPRGDLILVAHSGVNRMLYAALTGSDPVEGLNRPQPYGGVTHLLLEGDKAWGGAVGKTPEELPPPVPDEETAMALLRRFGTPERVIAHSRAVAQLADELCRTLTERGIALNAPLIYAGALLHDIAKTQPRHAQAGAIWLTRQGYPSVGAVVGEHMYLTPADAQVWSEGTVVFLADKLVRETTRVTLEERFFAQPAPEKQPYLQQRYETAHRLWQMLQGTETQTGKGLLT